MDDPEGLPTANTQNVQFRKFRDCRFPILNWPIMQTLTYQAIQSRKFLRLNVQ